MATSRRDVELALRVQAEGGDDVQALAGEFRNLGSEGRKTAASTEELAAGLASAARDTDKFRQAETQARDALKGAQRDLQAKRDALTALRLETDASGRKTDEYQTKVRASRLAVFEAEKSVRALKDAHQQAGTAASQAAQAQTRLDQALARQQQATTGATQSARGLSNELAQVRTVAAAAGAVLGGQLLGGVAGDISRIADQYANLGARIKLVTGEGAAFNDAFKGVFDVAQRTNTTVEATGTLFARLAQAGKAVGVSTADALRLTETVNQAVQVSGTSAEASNAAIIQLIQGLQSGVLRGDEFNSVMEQAPRLATALADGLGVTTGELRKMAEAGKLTSETVISSLRGQADVLRAEFEQLPATVGRAVTNLSTAWTAYVGEVDKAHGVSTAIAGAINTVARNLDTLGAVLLSVGKAAAAYKALDLAKLFHAKAVAVAADTAAVTANTVQTAANTAAKRANAAATTEATQAATAGTGRLAAALGGLKLFALVAVLTNVKEIGTAIGEGIAKWAGWGKAIEEAEQATRLQDEASRAAAASTAAVAQQMQIAREKSLGLTDESRKLVNEFEGLRLKGESTAEAIEKLTKNLRLDDISGITTAGLALNALAQKGQMTADQVRDAWSTALKSIDLGTFAVEARAAFGESAEGAQRLALAMDGALREAIRRAGLDFEFVSGGMSRASVSAVNDLGTIVAGLDRLKASGADTGQLLAASIGKAINAADSQRAVDAVRVQIEGLRKVLGDKITDGFIDQASQKAVELKDNLDKALPGINSIREAYRQLGLQAPADLGRIATANGQAWNQIKQDGMASAETLKAAFTRYAQSAIDAAGTAGRTTAEAVLQAEAASKGLQVTFDQTGRAIVRGAFEAAAAMDKTTEAVDRTTAAVDRQADAVQRLDAKYKGLTADGFEANKDGSAKGTFTNNLPVDLAYRIKQTGGGEGMTEDEIRRGIQQAENAFRDMQAFMKLNPGAASFEYQQSTTALMNAANIAKQRLTSGPLRTGTQSQQPSSAPTAARTVNVNIGGRTSSVNVASQADSDALVAILRQLESASRSTA